MKIIILLATSALLLTGCTTVQEKYKDTGWYTPSGFNYTLAVDHEGMKPSQHYFGFSWDLK